jgi:hypothetical protein
MSTPVMSRRRWFPGVAIFVLALLAPLAQSADSSPVWASLTAPSGGPAGVPDGAGELSLDRGAVLSLMTAAMPRTLMLVVSPAEEVTLAIQPPSRLEFVDGGIEAEITFTLEELSFSTPIRIRYVPEVEPRHGLLRLVATEAVPDLLLPVPVDLAPLLPVVDLPRSFTWSLKSHAGQAVPVRCIVQGVEIGEERLVVRLGFAAGP